VKAIFGNKLVPSYADHYLAKNGYDSQQYDGAEDPNRPNNLWEPVPGDHGAHGVFDSRATEHSSELWLETHTAWLALAAGLGVVGTILGAFKRNRSRAADIRQPLKRAA
jgi:hypothetical protein